MFRIKPSTVTAMCLALSTVLGTTAVAEQGDWLVRVGASVIDPKSDNLTLAPLTTLQVDEEVQPTFDVTYMFRNRWGVELLASTVWDHGLFVKSPAGTAGFGRVRHLPPTLSLQYHFNPDGRVRPYAGVGVNYTRFSGERPATLELDNSVGPAAQLGVDFGLNDKWFLNVSARYIDIDTDAKLGGTKLGKVEVDPFVYGLHVGYKFGKPAAPAPAPVAAPVEPPPPPPPPADTDGDGVIDSRDACPGTPAGTRVDARGCELDSDGDGVVDSKDRCPNTPAGSKVDEYGCSLAARLEVHFDTASAVLKPESYADLDAVAKFMTDVPRVAGVLEGHTDSVGNDKSNERLSQRRAESVKAYLVSKGIDPARLQTQGFGESQPEADNATADGRAKNRRVVLRRTDTQ
ncbi:MAG: OmpW family outer membrane protein [Steroidobacteraceae bacterium]|nr:OmpA family protein [Nevskiaceae bacterium]MCP5471546.1 OmpA family protein [Nevskiaceae bacterium]